MFLFKPKLLPTIGFLLLLPILLSLGFWQLSRMEEKQTRLDLQTQSQSAEPVAFEALAPNPVQYTKIKVSGKFLDKFSVLLEHQIKNGEHGYHLLTPLEIKPDLPWLWVDRGFISQPRESGDDVTLPDNRVLQDNVHLKGSIYYPSRVGFILGDNLHHRENTWYIQRIDIAPLNAQFHHEAYPYVLLLNPTITKDPMPPSKHLGYAVQWFALALTLIVLYLIVSLQRKKP